MAIKKYETNGKNFYEVYVNGHDTRGRRLQWRKRGIETLKRAENVEFDLMRKLADRKDVPGSYLFGEWVSKCLKNMQTELAASTYATYSAQITKWMVPHLKDRDMTSISKSEVHDLIFEGCEFPTAHTRRNVFKMTKRMFQLAVEEGIIERNPCIGMKVRVSEVDQKVLTVAEADRFLLEAKRCHHHFYPIWLMALMTGMRSGELFALRWTDIDLDGRIISVGRQWTSKGGFGPTKTRRIRIVPISDDLVKFLKEWKLKHPGEFVLPHPVQWTGGEQARLTRDLCEGIGITSVKFHDLRATFITNLLAQGESLARVMSIVGHSELKTTNSYLRKAGVDVKGGTDKLSYRVPLSESAIVLPFTGKSS
jgi:integrase